jgi:thiol:disulfide interchange protein DsbD
VQKFSETIAITSHTYENEAYLIAEVKAPDTLTAGTPVTITASVDWQACKETCTAPTTTPLTLELSVADGAAAPSPAAAGIEAAWKAGQGMVPTVSASATAEDGQVALVATLPEDFSYTGDLYFLPEQPGIVEAGSDQISVIEGDQLSIFAELVEDGDEPVAVPAGLSGFVVGEGAPAIWLTSGEPGESILTPVPEASDSATEPQPAGSADVEEQFAAVKEMRSWGLVNLAGAESVDPQSKSFIGVAFLALLGGIILNLMPCVFPVLGIKIMGFVNQAGEDKALVRRHGLAFGAGVIISLWALVAVLYAFRAVTDSKAGWGFQLQNPMFVFALIAIMFIFALNLAGLFEFGASLTGAGGKLQSKSGLSGSFFSGTLAVLVATPCTGPFMAAALGYALSSPIWVSFLIFTALGIGLALPYVVLSYIPGLVQKLPRPGAWMETFKQVMSFPLFATVIWLLYVFTGSTSRWAGTLLLIGLLTVAFGLWAYGRFGSPIAKPGVRRFGKVAGVLGLAGMVYFGAKASKLVTIDDSDTIVSHGITWERFDPVKVVEHRRAGRAMFIDFTADW